VSRFLDWLDESAAGIIRVAYLLAGVIAVASYFSDGNVPRGFSDFLNSILPWALAGALEIHTYLTARRVRKAWQDWSATSLGSDEHERAWTQLKLNFWILVGLLTFSIYNQLQYLAATWTPPHTPLTPPGPWAYIIRAVVTPSAFMAAAFLAPVGEGLALQVQSQAHHLAIMTFKVAVSQWKRRLKQMQQAGQDVTGALVQLVDDPAERRVIAAIWHAMQHPGRLPAPTELAEITPQGAGVALPPSSAIDGPPPIETTGGHPTVVPDGPPAPSPTSPDDFPTPPPGPVGPGTPVSKGKPKRAPAAAAIRLVTEPRTRQTKRTAARANALSGKRGTAEQRVRAALAESPELSIPELVARTGVSPSTASKYARLVESERAAQQAAQ